jgi:hypothetical protein
LNAAFYEYKYAVDFASETRIVSDPCTRYGGFRDQNAGLAVGGSRPQDNAVAVPAVNQIEQHPYFSQADVQGFGEQHGILAQAWSPIGGITFYRDSGHTSALEDPVIGRIAQAHGKTPAQAMLRWGLQHGRSVTPSPSSPSGSPRTSTCSTSS